MGERLVDGISPTEMPSRAHYEQAQTHQGSYNIHRHTLEEVDSAKYLGLNKHKTSILIPSPRNPTMHALSSKETSANALGRLRSCATTPL